MNQERSDRGYLENESASDWSKKQSIEKRKKNEIASDWSRKMANQKRKKLPGKRRGRSKRRFLDVVKEDMKEVGVKEMDIEDRKMWRMMIRCGHP